MSIFKNKVLAELDDMTVPSSAKIQQVMLFTLIDNLICGGYEHEDEFVNDLKSLLGE